MVIDEYVYTFKYFFYLFMSTFNLAKSSLKKNQNY